MYEIYIYNLNFPIKTTFIKYTDEEKFKIESKVRRIHLFEKYMKMIPNNVDLNENFLCCQQTHFQGFHILIFLKNRATVNLNYSILLCIIIYIFIHQACSDKGQYPMRDEKA